MQSQEYKTNNIEPGIYNQEYKAVQGEAAKQGRGRRKSETCNIKPGIQSQEPKSKSVETGI